LPCNLQLWVPSPFQANPISSSRSFRSCRIKAIVWMLRWLLTHFPGDFSCSYPHGTMQWPFSFSYFWCQSSSRLVFKTFFSFFFYISS
jgi:hypothetical protein